MLTFVFSWVTLLTLIVGTVLPVLVALVTTRVTSSGKKAGLLAGLSAGTGFLSELLDALQAGVPYDVFAGLVTAITVFIVAVALHFGLWKPTGVAAKVQGDTGLVR
jgi:hypothetical protein